MKSTRRAFLSAGGASALALGLTACSKSRPKPGQTLASGTPIAEPVLNDKQLDDILQRVQAGLDDADKEKNADKLKEVLSGPAARIRAAEYATASASGSNDYIHPLSTKSQGGGVGQTVGFPRNAAVASEGASPSILSLEQNSARDQFKVWAWVQGFSVQKSIPVLTKQTAQRAKQVTADSAGLVSTPQAVLAAYVDALNSLYGQSSTESSAVGALNVWNLRFRVSIVLGGTRRFIDVVIDSPAMMDLTEAEQRYFDEGGDL